MCLRLAASSFSRIPSDDNDIETSIRVQVRLNALDEDDDASGGNAILPSDESHSSPTNLRLDMSMEHGKTVAGTEAACSLKTQSSIVDCGSCIESTFSEFVAPLDGERQRLARSIFDQVRASSESGTSKSRCLVCFILSMTFPNLLTLLYFEALGAHDIVMDLLQRMSQTSPPIILWVGYSAPVIVSSQYARAWTVEIGGEPNTKTLVLPRRWLDIHGGKIRGTWDAALRAVVGIVIFHPGISQVSIFRKRSHALDTISTDRVAVEAQGRVRPTGTRGRFMLFVPRGNYLRTR